VSSGVVEEEEEEEEEAGKGVVVADSAAIVGVVVDSFGLDTTGSFPMMNPYSPWPVSTRRMLCAHAM
jgi:hypothetical protein